MGKPTICIGENKGADQVRGNREADQRLCFRYSDSTIPPQTCSETTLLVFPRGGSNHNVMYDSYLLKDVHSVLVNFPREYAQESMMLYI